MRGPRNRRLGPLTRSFAVSLKSCGRTFNALTKTPMAHLRQEGPLARSRPSDDRGQEPDEDRGALRRSSETAFRWRHRFLRAPASDKPRALRGIVEADETFILESFKGRWSDLPRKARKRGGTARHPGLHQDNIPILVARDRKGATFDAVLPQVDSASVGAALASVITPGNHLIGDGGKAIAAFARRAGFPSTPCLRPESQPRDAPPAHQQRQRLPRPPQTVAQPLQRRRHQEPAKLSRMAPRSRSLGRQTPTAKLDQRRHRKRTIPTANALRADLSSEGRAFRGVATTQPGSRPEVEHGLPVLRIG